MDTDSDSDSDSPVVSRPFAISPEHHSGLLPPTYNVYPGGSHSLSGIAARAACLGFAAGVSLFLTFAVGYFQLPFFLFLLSLFHLLEFWTTARYNTPNAKTSSAFLLSTNGSAYNIAHSAAILEAVIELYFFPSFKQRISFFPTILGLALIAIGQSVRTLAMVHAGTNFNHVVQRQRRPGHTLVKHGVYSWLRHPSYYGFFWWGLGTQLMLANPVCFLGYAVVLWKFFHDRIKFEERHLVDFFGEEYITYRAATMVGIPFIR
ncbi:S-isoprenylcysteine O-methyltransferase [Tirmania nivea]|nr:S-isoprenylcysteine O-methyltransferase [Tirmania nivea]